MDDLGALARPIADFLASVDGGRRNGVVSHVEPLPGGQSRVMLRFAVQGAGGTRRYVLRGDPPPELAPIVTDRQLEWDLLSTLTAHGAPWMPAAHCFDGAGAILGTPAIILEHLDQVDLLRALAGPRPPSPETLADRTCDLMVNIHRTDLTMLPEKMERPASWSTHVDHELDALAAALNEAFDPDPVFRYVLHWLSTRRPPPAPFVLVHGDLKLGNMLLAHDGSLTAVDWELARVGDPREDLGQLDLSGKMVGPNLYRLNEAAFCRRYSELSGLGPDLINPATVGWFTVFQAAAAMTKITGPVSAYARGVTDHLALAQLISFQTFLRATAMEAIEAIDKLATTTESLA